MVWTTNLSSKGQLVLPKPVRDKLGAGPGTTILLVEREGRIELVAHKGDILRWYGSEPVSSPQDWEAVEQATAKARAIEVLRESQGD
ncbi:MAG TPA: AbrB/MazE/SpoVT family DNA-binding domain-containing protein [Thermoanaerobaculia bacterium]|nr:AbrB/MazE/SpoVT family DNA-binding domain-containing protein [Thermoanaerobaculia bacterium]